MEKVRILIAEDEKKPEGPSGGILEKRRLLC